jgi:alkylation response protein AidB-like acyl-CoA dehydrogenase
VRTTFGTVYLAIPALVAASSGPARDELLGDLIEGRRTAAVAVVDRAGVFDPEAVTVTADGDALSGTVTQVVDGGIADVLLVAARGSDGVALYAVDTAAAGVQRAPLATLDLTRSEANVTFSDAPARVIAGPDETARVLDHALQVGAALLAIQQVGAAQHLLDLSVEYAKSRLQFGRPIGSFQGVKHRLADLLVDVEHAIDCLPCDLGADRRIRRPGIGDERRASGLLYRAQPCRHRHHPGARRNRVHL